MLICGECSARNKVGESFCSSCGAYLGWQAQQQGDSSAPETDSPSSGPEQFPPTVMLPQLPVPSSRPKFGQQPKSPAPDSPSGRRRGTPVGEEGAARTGQGKVTSRPRTEPPGATNNGPVPVIDEEPAAVQPGERIVTAPRARRGYDEAPPGVATLTCATCGTANNADRHFCRKCADTLDSHHLAAGKPALKERGHNVLPAGSRPKWKTRQFPSRCIAGITAVLLLGGGTYLGRDALAESVQRVHDEFADDGLTVSLTASDFLKGREPDLAKDTFVDRGWAAKLPKGDKALYLEAQFAEPVRLVYVFITAKAEKVTPSQKQEQVPTRIGISVLHSGSDLKTGLWEHLPQHDILRGEKRQGVYVGSGNVTAVRITVEEPKEPPGTTVSLAELQFSGWVERAIGTPSALSMLL